MHLKIRNYLPWPSATRPPEILPVSKSRSVDFPLPNLIKKYERQKKFFNLNF